MSKTGIHNCSSDNLYIRDVNNQLLFDNDAITFGLRDSPGNIYTGIITYRKQKGQPRQHVVLSSTNHHGLFSFPLCTVQNIQKKFIEPTKDKMSKETTFENANIGDIVYHGALEGTISNIRLCDLFQLTVSFFNGSMQKFTLRGQPFSGGPQTLFWQPVDLKAIAPERPRVKVKKWRWVAYDTKLDDYYTTDSHYSDETDWQQDTGKYYEHLRQKIDGTEKEMYPDEH